MKIIKLYLVLFLTILSTPSWSAIYWVGDSAACTGSNVYNSFFTALAVSAGNGDSSDEIRMTNTMSYTGNTNGHLTLTDRDSSGPGTLTLVGGYPDCFTSPNSRTLVGNSNFSSFTVNTNLQSSSVVTLRNLRLFGNASRGLVARAGAFVTLDNVVVESNGFSGVDVSDGAFVEILSNSRVQNNLNFNNPFGGGVRCTGANSTVIIHGILEKNRAQKGGNLFVSTGCYAELKDGMRIIGGANLIGDAVVGGGAYIDSGGLLFADGRTNRVIFDANIAENGGALFLNGSGFALLQNTHMNASEADNGAAIYAQNGGVASPQLIMDQTTDCNLLFRCSEIQASRYLSSVIAVDNSMIQLQRTVIELSEFFGQDFASGLITSYSDSLVRLNRVGIIRNEGHSMLRLTTNDQHQISHLTMADNTRINNGNQIDSFVATVLAGSLDIQNSLLTDSNGIDNRSTGASFAGGCNLIDNDFNWPSGTYHLGAPQLVNPPAGDARQLAGSLGVDMCLQDSFSWSSEIDIENQAAPVNENTNQQGMPGQAGGLYDAGFDEVYDNIGPDEFLLTIQKEGSGDGVVVSNPAGISCGVDCSEVFFNGTIVTLNAAPITGSDFDGWLNCPLVNQTDQCLTSVESSHTIRAVFIPNDLIFADSFD